jgi:hypothetical protein
MLKLGDYDEDGSKAVAECLKKAGVRVELKPSIGASLETEDLLQGRLSELKAIIKDKELLEEYERYLDALRKILAQKVSPEDFEKEYLAELFPTMDEKRKALSDLIDRALGDGKDKAEHGGSAGTADAEGSAKGEAVGETINQTLEPSGENAVPEAQPTPSEGSKNNACLPTQEKNADEFDIETKEAISAFVSLLAKSSGAETFVRSVLFLNELEIGGEVGNRLDDPIIAIPVDDEEYGKGCPNLLRVLSVHLNKVYDLYVDEISLLMADLDKLDEEFIDNYTDENIKIRSLDLMLANLIENHPSEKMDFSDFEEECNFRIDKENRVLEVFGDAAAEEIARVLEKSGMVKIKGGTLRWRK